MRNYEENAWSAGQPRTLQGRSCVSIPVRPPTRIRTTCLLPTRRSSTTVPKRIFDIGSPIQFEQPNETA